jgi:hypothetical protein
MGERRRKKGIHRFRVENVVRFSFVDSLVNGPCLNEKKREAGRKEKETRRREKKGRKEKERKKERKKGIHRFFRFRVENVVRFIFVDSLVNGPCLLVNAWCRCDHLLCARCAALLTNHQHVNERVGDSGDDM